MVYQPGNIFRVLQGNLFRFNRVASSYESKLDNLIPHA